MVDRLRWYIETQNGDITGYQFNNNRDVIGVKVLLKEGFEAFKGQEITVKYALNAVLSDLILFGTAKIGDSDTVNITLDVPVAASHVFVTVPNSDIIKEEIELYEELKEKTTNYYPMHFDTILDENYYLDTVSVFTSKEGYSNYSVFTSLDGRDFQLLVSKQDDKPCDFTTGDVYNANGREARIIRVYIEYNSSYVEALLADVKYTGVKSNTPVISRPAISVVDFKDSEYNVAVTEIDTYNEIYGIIERRLGAEYKAWFSFELANNPKGNNYDFFELTFVDNKVNIKGNNGVSICVGLNHYLKYYCKVNISQVGDQAKMPDDIVPLKSAIFKETKGRVRYSYNYCTLSYSMAFWGEKEWQDELDWLALNGVNVVLDATAQEEVWRRFLTEIGYEHEEIKRFIAGPAYYAWAYMANLSGFGGPVHDSWFYDRTELARKNHLKMRKLGMYPVLQGYSGMVPNDIRAHDENADIILQGTWGSFERPTMLRTTSAVFRNYAEKFYKAQNEVYGDYSMYFATDPFHEGGNTGDMKPREISKEVLTAMLKNNSNAVWIIQSWQNNPTSELLRGLDDVENGKQHALILDLYAEKMPNYKNGHSENPDHGYAPEFDNTPWVFCMLNNFGGRLGLHGHLDNLANWIPEAFNNCNCIAGIGITPEASFNNPVLYDFLFESIWHDNADSQMIPINLENWTKDYAERRYGAKSNNANKAWKIFINTVYKGELNNLGQGAPESIVNARPGLVSKPASSWGNAVISYDKKELIKAAKLLLEDYDLLKDSMGYKYDLITVLQQVLSNTAQDVHLQMATEFNNKNLENFKIKAAEFLNIADLMDEVLSGSEYYLLGRWVEQAKALAVNADDFAKKLYEQNAKMIITTWGAYNQCEIGGIRDYSNRQWSGLIKDFYKPRWVRWINDRINELEGKDFEEKISWFSWEWQWARSNTAYDNSPQDINLLEIAKKVISIL